MLSSHLSVHLLNGFIKSTHKCFFSVIQVSYDYDLDDRNKLNPAYYFV